MTQMGNTALLFSVSLSLVRAWPALSGAVSPHVLIFISLHKVSGGDCTALAPLRPFCLNCKPTSVCVGVC